MDFSINAGTFTLKNTSQPKNSILSRDVNYVIPIYQRPYSWGENQISKFILDIFNSFWGYNRDSTPEPMFIGTMQLSNINNGEQNIIDGQQRLSTFLIFLKVLKLEYSNCDDLNQLNFNWLTTKVNNGKQQDKLNELLRTSSFMESSDNKLNKYIENAVLIRDIFLKNIKPKNEDDKEFSLDEFISHILSHIYFVVIETKASLSKTLQIFDAINTTGLDLNAGDIFKIRMFEYLNKDGNNDNVFNDISKLYQKIDTRNTQIGMPITDINGILHIYQFYLIGKYKLPTVLYNYGVNTFFDRLFETLFNINKWEHFKNNVENGKVTLSLNEIDEIIDIRYDWEVKWRSNEYGSAKNKNLLHLWWWSRYGRYWILKFVFLFVHKDESDKYDKLYEFSEKLIKLHLLYSVVYQKSVNAIKGQFTNKLIDLLVNSNYSDLLDHIEKKLSSESGGELKRFSDIINGDILFSAKVKNILCRLSALLEENYMTTEPDEIWSITEKLFHTKIDIEHIQSYNDENTEEREKIKNSWGKELNSIGNLVVLEQSLNRSILNHENKKIDNYRKSKFKIVNRELTKHYLGWNLEKSLKRKSYETSKIIEFITKIK